MDMIPISKRQGMITLFMIPVMFGLINLVISADKLHAWHYSEDAPMPTTADYSYASFAFFTALLVPLVIGFFLSVLAFQQKRKACWPILETVIVGLPLLLIVGILPIYPIYAEALLMPTLILIGCAVVLSLDNIGTCIRHKDKSKFALSALTSAGGECCFFW